MCEDLSLKMTYALKNVLFKKNQLHQQLVLKKIQVAPKGEASKQQTITHYLYHLHQGTVLLPDLQSVAQIS